MDFKTLRDKMVDHQIISRGISDRRVIKAISNVGRHLFVPERELDLAYQDMAVSIGYNQTISQPYMVALMTQSLMLREDDVVLEIGTGSGYQTAVLAGLCREVYTIERIKELSQKAQEILKALKVTNVHFYIGDGSEGIKEYAGQFDAIMVTAATPEPLEHLYACLKEGGRILMPIGHKDAQTLTLFVKGKDIVESQEICRCVFVPLLGKYGFSV